MPAKSAHNMFENADASKSALPDSPNDLSLYESSLDEDAQRRVQERWQRVRTYGISAGGYNLLAPVGLYCELLTQVQIAPLPNTPAHFLGLTNVRGNLVPVYHLEPLLGLPSMKPTYVLLMGNLPNAGALVVKNKPIQFDLAAFQPQQMPESLPEPLRSSLAASYKHQQDNWYAVDHVSLFNQLVNAGNARDLDVCKPMEKIA